MLLLLLVRVRSFGFQLVIHLGWILDVVEGDSIRHLRLLLYLIFLVVLCLVELVGVVLNLISLILALFLLLIEAGLLLLCYLFTYPIRQHKILLLFLALGKVCDLFPDFNILISAFGVFLSVV